MYIRGLKRSVRTTWSFRKFFFVVIMIAVIGQVAVNDWVMISQMEQQMMVSIEDENDMVTNTLSDMLTGFFNVPVQELLVMKNSFRLHEEEQESFEHAIEIMGTDNSFNRISEVSGKGVIVSTWPEDPYYIGLDISRNGYLEKLGMKEAFYWSKTYTEPVTGKSNIDLIVPYGDGYFLGTIDLSRLQAYISQLKIKEGAIVTIVDQGGGYLAHTDLKMVVQRMKDPFTLRRQVDAGTVADKTIKIDGKQYYPFSAKVSGTDWNIVAYYDRESYRDPIGKMIRSMILTQLTSLMFAMLVIYLSGRYFQRQTDHLLEFTRRISDGDYMFKVSDSRFQEFKELLTRFEAMAGEIGGREEEILELNSNLEEKISERTDQLVQANTRLEQAMVDLKETQSQLLQKEKMASLGVLVAGIAHEVNTPIGVCLTTSTFLTQQGDLVREKFENGTLKNAELKEFFDILDESGELVYHNLQHAGELISTFKQISQSQSPYEMEPLEVKMYINSLVGELYSRYPEIHMEVISESDEILMVCYPSDMDLIIRNLVTNAVIHGCEGRDGSRVDVFIKMLPDGCRISVADNGKGIPESEINRIFDPFYTTRRGKGGSGLGLHIIYNIITQRYHGTITCSSVIGVGTAFDMFFPNLNDATNSIGGADVQFQE